MPVGECRMINDFQDDHDVKPWKPSLTSYSLYMECYIWLLEVGLGGPDVAALLHVTKTGGILKAYALYMECYIWLLGVGLGGLYVAALLHVTKTGGIHGTLHLASWGWPWGP